MFKFDSGKQKRLSNLEVREYILSWINNGLWSGSPEMTVIHAFNESKSLVEWFGTSNVDLDDEYAVKFINLIKEN